MKMLTLVLDVSNLLIPIVIALIVIWITKRFARLTVAARKWWLFAHVMSSVVYFSGVLGTLLLAVLTKFATDSREIVMAHQFIPFFDWFLIIPGAFFSLITGFALAIRTNWGLTSYYWVMAKWLGNIGGIMFGATVMRHWLHEPLANLPPGGANLLTDPTYAHNRQLLFLGIAISLSLLTFLAVISYLKPWGKRAGAQVAGQLP